MHHNTYIMSAVVTGPATALDDTQLATDLKAALQAVLKDRDMFVAADVIVEEDHTAALYGGAESDAAQVEMSFSGSILPK